ncbi:acetyl/propionyl/methylcrotonyl-CoA carboxylase subunit alpha [Georgenia yuyongxinii]|uniref:ATP-grasp domain-containing protein n=1 Tax=Georgenia yuyongxinii TaxID=2589797 RepID=A0A552WJL4_9MICO|nr:biotin carboxylase N-terminal domain-containing protein [Georgenia yuyongxinii]TRW42951.1 ATP-grasp domain-containing protein [Georgenia yuyongxinii]
MFASLLVANRGEIALRVIRAARAAGLRTVAVYSDADRDAPHVTAADDAVRLGPAPATESYLSIDAILAAASATGADAVHPGYGFLSESAELARACEEAGLVWVGPPSAVVARMGRKDAAREAAEAAGVDVLPGITDDDDARLAARAIAEVGLPVMVKAAAGGGGKGMRVVTDAGEMPRALAAAHREAVAAFGDGTLLVERYVPRGRHVEVQVLADTHGHVLHLGERDCSVQRRHQKVVEESPAPMISTDLRARVCDAAVRLSREIGYVGAGTVEFLVAGAGTGAEAYFLEMNTRLQVEHPVTEAVTGLDLVALQLTVAQGASLPLTQADVNVRGHAIEARVYAEDADFLPQAGLASAVRWPAGARVDAGLVAGQEVGTWYDPLLGKVIAHGPTREAARLRLVAALDDTAILGLTTNAGMLRRLLASEAFARSELDTGWLDEHPRAFPPGPADVALCAAAWVLGAMAADDVTHPFGVGDGWRSGGPPGAVHVDLNHGGARHRLRVDRAARRVKLVRDEVADPFSVVVGRSDTAPDEDRRAIEVRLEVGGAWQRATVLAADLGMPGHAPGIGAGVAVAHHGEAYRFTVHDPLTTATVAPADGVVSAPMPGQVRAVSVVPDERVAAGQVLGVLEAMKMEMPLIAPHAGTVESVDTAVGDQVELGQTLFTVAGEEL